MLATGFYVVNTDEQAVVRRFGALAARVGPGMHYRLPWPVDQVDVVKTTSVKKTGVGFDLAEGEQATVVGMELLTGDTNILNVALVLQYVIRSPADFLFRIDDPDTLIGNLAETVLTETVVGMAVDDVLTTGRLALQERVKTETQAMLDRYQSGVQLTSSNIMAISLDPSVAEAFQDVTDAMADREKSRNEARMYANNLLPKARGEAHAMVREAHAYKGQRVAEAIGDTERFLAAARGIREGARDHPVAAVPGGHGADPAAAQDLRGRTRKKGACPSRYGSVGPERRRDAARRRVPQPRRPGWAQSRHG